MRLAATRTEPLGATHFAASLAGDEPSGDLPALIDQLTGRAGADALFTVGAVETDVPERATIRARTAGSAERLACLASSDPSAASS